jgi:hypothetical protein
MKALIDTEVYLYRAAAAAEVEAEWSTDDWTYLCRHGDAQATFQDAIGEIRDTLPHPGSPDGSRPPVAALIAAVEAIQADPDDCKDYENDYRNGWIDACNAVLELLHARLTHDRPSSGKDQ